MNLIGENMGGRRPYLRWDRPAELSTSPTPQTLSIICFYFVYDFVAIFVLPIWNTIPNLVVVYPWFVKSKRYAKTVFDFDFF